MYDEDTLGPLLALRIADQRRRLFHSRIALLLRDFDVSAIAA